MSVIKRLQGTAPIRTPPPAFWAGLIERLPRSPELKDPVSYWHGARWASRMQQEKYTGLGSRRARALVRLARSIEQDQVPGVIVDCGVWNGGSTILMSMAAPSRTIWAFDSFEGMPEPGEFDDPAAFQFVGDARGSESKLREGFARYAYPDQLRVAKGWFQDTFARFAHEIDVVAMLHVDADWYESQKLALETFYPKLSPGGYCAVDDYTYWSGTRRAVDEFRQQQQVSAPIISKHYWRKPA